MIWRACHDFPNYEVSSDGKVRRLVTVRGRKPFILKPWDNGRGYQKVGLRLNGKTTAVYVHRLVAKAFLGLKDSQQVDHQFHNTTDIKNLRICNPAENSRNSRPHKDSTSKFKGVSWDKSKRKWYACIKVDGRNKSLGVYEREIEAAIAYDFAARTAWGSFAFLNFPINHQPRET